MDHVTTADNQRTMLVIVRPHTLVTSATRDVIISRVASESCEPVGTYDTTHPHGLDRRAQDHSKKVRLDNTECTFSANRRN